MLRSQICSSNINSKASKTRLVFEDTDIKITEAPNQQAKGVGLGFVVLYTDGNNTEVMPRNFVHDFIGSNADKLAGYNVIMVDGKDEGPAAGHTKAPSKSNTKYIYIGVGVALGIIALLALVFVVKRFVCCTTVLFSVI